METAVIPSAIGTTRVCLMAVKQEHCPDLVILPLGTVLWDPVEIVSIKEAIGDLSLEARPHVCFLGSQLWSIE